MWGVVAFFAYDNVLNWLAHPIILSFFMIMLVGFGYLFATGNLYRIKNVSSFIQSYVTALIIGTKPPTINTIFGDIQE